MPKGTKQQIASAGANQTRAWTYHWIQHIPEYQLVNLKELVDAGESFYGRRAEMIDEEWHRRHPDAS